METILTKDIKLATKIKYQLERQVEDLENKKRRMKNMPNYRQNLESELQNLNVKIHEMEVDKKKLNISMKKFVRVDDLKSNTDWSQKILNVETQLAINYESIS